MKLKVGNLPTKTSLMTGHRKIKILESKPIFRHLYGKQMIKHYSRTSVMWTPEGRTKSVHNSEVSTLVKLGLAMGHRIHNILPLDFSWHHGLSCTCETSVHRNGVSTTQRSPQDGVLAIGFIHTSINKWPSWKKQSARQGTN